MSLLAVEGVSRSFGGIRAVTGFDLTLGEGELVALIGPNGAGKTTVFNLITGVYQPDAGVIRFRGESLAGLPPHRIVDGGIARTFQNIRLFRDLTVLDNVRAAHFGRTPTSIWSALLRTPGCRSDEREVVDSSRRYLAALGLEADAETVARNMPYGRQRRLEIARALACDPQLLLLDEPAAGMNPQETRELEGLIVRLRKERHLSILLIDHDMKLVMNLAQKIFVLDYGEEIARGTPQEIASNPVVIKAYLGVETDAEIN